MGKGQLILGLPSPRRPQDFPSLTDARCKVKGPRALGQLRSYSVPTSGDTAVSEAPGGWDGVRAGRVDSGTQEGPQTWLVITYTQQSSLSTPWNPVNPQVSTTSVWGALEAWTCVGLDGPEGPPHTCALSL